MTSSDPDIRLVERIIEVLEEHGIGRYEYQLYDVVDPDALEKVITSGGEEVEVRITICGVTLLVQGDGAVGVKDTDE